MKELLKLQSITYEIMNAILFEKINATVKQGEIIGLIGKNGSGKSTLLQLIRGNAHPTEGEIQWHGTNMAVAYVEQEQEHYEVKEATAKEAELMAKWNLPMTDYQYMSGGEKLKLRLAHGFAQDAGLLLLDEPTNHLDERSMEVLINHIKRSKKTIILVSHDRYFLDKVATKIWSIEEKKLVEHKGNYTGYQKWREQKRITQQREYEKQQKQIERIETQMKELTSWSQKAHAQSTKQEGTKEYYRMKAKRMDAQVKSKQKRLEKELQEKKVEQVKPNHEVQFSIQSNHKKGKRFLEVKHLNKSFNRTSLFKNVHFTIQHGEKMALVGPNGSGKTTLLKIIMGQETAEGEVWLSPSANIGYLTQEVFDLPTEKTPEQLFYKETFEERGKVQNLMKHLGFSASQWTEPIKNMSMGERVKCKLMKYILEEKDVLILDEPTNHLDLPSREQLEQTLAQYTGTLLVVSHDQYFLEKTTTNQLVVANNGVAKQSKNMLSIEDDFLEQRMRLETERQEVLGKLSFLQQKDEVYVELDKRFQELTKQIKELS
ncbi:ribosomal protection-like ABC-F family protein [Niallia nealsonii]|uniref:Ribosome protection protein VmlR n=1 Tax=Niallia nealsonii TaxID=115979 RepID=A0A2N0YYJ9_9BACI|nr:ABC-F type ribosomal protection protein [Niallia nealsonii]PKG22334.1 elongation factor 3 [Niallia nealsonii]